MYVIFFRIIIVTKRNYISRTKISQLLKVNRSFNIAHKYNTSVQYKICDIYTITHFILTDSPLLTITVKIVFPVSIVTMF